MVFQPALSFPSGSVEIKPSSVVAVAKVGLPALQGSVHIVERPDSSHGYGTVTGGRTLEQVLESRFPDIQSYYFWMGLLISAELQVLITLLLNTNR